MGPNKRHAATTPSRHQQNEKTQRTTASTVLSMPKAAKPTSKQTGNNTVVPATPGAAVDPSAKRKQPQSPAKEPRPEKRQKTTQAASKERPPKQPPQKQPEQPGTLPLEPHAAILSELEPKYDVRALSVISSSSMEKRIQAVLNSLASRPTTTTTTTQEGQTTSASPRPGIVLLHGRASDANKLISITEIVKQRMREDYFSQDAAGAGSAPAVTEVAKKKGKKGSRLSKTSWFQYNRIYDVVSVKGKGTDGDSGDEEEEDDGFAPMVHRFREAMRGKKASQGQASITTYMSIILSRTPVVELQKNPGISVQASTDPLEIEYEQWMAST